MNTNNGVFGHATGFAGAATVDLDLSGPFGAVRRRIQDVFVQGGAASAATSVTFDVLGIPRTGVAPPTRTAAPHAMRRTAAQDLVQDVRRRSGLTLEEIAGVLGTSRRTLHLWSAGKPISAGNDRSLRALAGAIARLDAGDAQATRRRLLDHADGEISSLDLLAEGRHEEAVALATGTAGRAPIGEGRGLAPSIAARVASAGDAHPLSSGTPGRRRIRRR